MNAIPGFRDPVCDDRPRSAVLFSGGLDSLCAAVLHPEATLIRVATGSQYDKHERQCAVNLAHAIGRSIVLVDDVLFLTSLEQRDGLMPGRNAFIALAAAPYAQVLMLTSVNGDGTHATDKDAEFARLMSRLLTKLFGNGGLALPYRDISKHALFKKALDFDQPRGRLLHALPSVWSCYGPGGMHCGRCKACVRLWAALECCYATDYGPQFTENPLDMSVMDYNRVFIGRGEEMDNAVALRKRLLSQ